MLSAQFASETEGMICRILSFEDIPPRDPDEVLRTRQIPLARRKRTFRAAEENPGTLVVAPIPRANGVLAAYLDGRFGRQPEIRAILRRITYDSGSLFAIDCFASSGFAQIGRCFHLFCYEEAWCLLIAFIDLATSWLDSAQCNTISK